MSGRKLLLTTEAVPDWMKDVGVTRYMASSDWLTLWPFVTLGVTRYMASFDWLTLWPFVFARNVNLK